jgi:hypothetical protein
MAILKLTVITDWSWWRASLPIVIFVGFNIASCHGTPAGEDDMSQQEFSGVSMGARCW